MKRSIAILLTLALLTAVTAVTGYAQTGEELLAQLQEEETRAIEALVLYPEDTRDAILEASLYPEALIKLESMQQRSSEDFQDLLQYYPRETQELIWDLTRYPNLVGLLADDSPGAETRLQRELDNYPTDIQGKAWRARTNHRNLLLDVDYLQRNSDAAFNELLMDYRPATRAALRELIQLPEVLSLLTENIRMTILVGDAYRHDPIGIRNMMADLSLEVARRQAEELEDWKNELENDPVAMEEYRQSAEAFADEYGYDDTYYDYGPDYDESTLRTRVVERHYYNYYPYWFGYPYWFDYPRWQPWPVWYDWGFYYGPRRTIVIVGFPSIYFTNWYFYRPRHHYHYAHLSAHFVDHYYVHRRSCSSITTTVHVWRNRNRAIITDEWLRNDNRRVERIREYGKFEMDREKYNDRHPDKQLTRVEYLERNQKRYDRMQPLLAARKEREAQQRERVIPTREEQIELRKREVERERTQPERERTIEPRTRELPERERTQPAPERKVEPRQREEPQRERTQPVPERKVEPRTRELPQKERTQPAPTRKPDPRKDDNKRVDPKVERGQNYHRNTWEKTRKQEPTRVRTTQPRTQTKPKPTTRPKPEPKRSKNEPSKSKRRDN